MEKKDGKTAVITVRDEKRLEETLALLHQIAAKPRFTSYQVDLLRERIPLLPPRRDFVSQIPRLVYVASLNAPGIPFRKLPDALAAGAQQCAARGDVEGFRRITGDWRALVTASIKDGDTMIDLMVAKAVMTIPATHFRDAAKTLGLENDAHYFEDLDERSGQSKEARDNRRRAGDAEREVFKKKSSILGGLTGPLLGSQVESPPRITDEDLRPGRYADHALIARGLSGSGWMVLAGFAIAAASGGFCKKPLAVRLAKRMTDLLRPRDWVLLFAGGVVFPLLWYLSMTRLTPLAAREWSAAYFAFIPAGGQFACFLLSLLILPVVIASGLLAKRGPALGWGSRYPWLGWLAAAAALAGVPAFGAIPHLAGAGNKVIVPAVVLVGFAAIWILIKLGLGRHSQALQRATLGRIVLPVWVSGMLALALSIPIHYAEEQRWIQQDRWGEITSDAPAQSRYEYEVTQVLRAELLEMLDPPDRVR